MKASAMEKNQGAMHWTDQHLSELSQLDGDTGMDILKACGRACCKQSDLYQGAIRLSEESHPGDGPDSLFERFKKEYYQNGFMTKTGKVITLIFEACTCPMVKSGTTNPFLCNCTTGYTERLFETLFNRPVTVKLEQSILRGNEICKQTIRIADKAAHENIAE